MESTVTVRGQTAIPAAIRRRYNIKPKSKLKAMCLTPLLYSPLRNQKMAVISSRIFWFVQNAFEILPEKQGLKSIEEAHGSK